MLDRKGFEFSFSGLKTAVSVHIEQHGQPGSRKALADLCASFQAAVVEVLVAKARLARKKFRVRAMTVVGGVSANSGCARRWRRRRARTGLNCGRQRCATAGTTRR
jgi:N6-L-threonylcarbamoyladenine synthase